MHMLYILLQFLRYLLTSTFINLIMNSVLYYRATRLLNFEYLLLTSFLIILLSFFLVNRPIYYLKLMIIDLICNCTTHSGDLKDYFYKTSLFQFHAYVNIIVSIQVLIIIIYLLNISILRRLLILEAFS